MPLSSFHPAVAHWFCEALGAPGSLLRVLRRLEDRGEVRGGRFVAGFGGEQFALPEVVPLLRKVRSAQPSGELSAISACDPLNLVGIITPGARIPQQAGSRVLLRDGLPVAALVAGQVRTLVEANGSELLAWHAALLPNSARGSLPTRASTPPNDVQPTNAISSISILAPRGSAATCTAALAGGALSNRAP